MSAHTKGPWKAYQKQGKDGRGLPQWRIHGPGIAGPLATVDFDLTQGTTARQDSNVAANAAFIVRACNSHEAMLEALKLAHFALLSMPDEVKAHLPGNVLPAIQQAIRLAEGRGER